ncbi:MAG: metal-dependent hydrolase [Candidatus Omnitrophica bacterium]|nr:metal-dependent hydrolase [Candidatus Omnitrophota bacterium]MCA9424481.1 metal-dependent hydrolase [Candidatus Omnitrophota bacterium]MCA9434138.1 metal-dependent hydrolase [Candidatus Omnitrophota bacterium]MCA9445909.1 metal-dependent hydrolase [Candidatus Omnitrophota bacterium]
MPTLTFIGHSCCLIESEAGTVLFDPFISGNNLASLKVENLPKISAVFLTHGHNDHVGDAIQIAKQHDCPIVATYELASYCQSKGTKSVPMNIGGTYKDEWGQIKLVQAFHSSSYTEENGNVVYTGMPTGMIYTVEGKTVYHLGDTALFSDLGTIGLRHSKIEVALVPIGDHFTMGIEDAVEAVRLIAPRLSVPVHYNTFPPIEQDPSEFKKKCKQIDAEVKVLKPGGTLEY